MGLQRGLGEKIKQIKSQDDIKSHSKTENLQTLRNTFPETKSKRMKQLNYKIKPKGKKRKRSRKVHKNKSNGKGWDKKEKGVKDTKKDAGEEKNSSVCILSSISCICTGRGLAF